MNVIFLDVDGVLNSITNFIEVCNNNGKRYSGFDYPFDEQCVENFAILVRCTHSKIVITSSWRKRETGIKVLMNKLQEYGLHKEVIGYTSILNTSRECEIKEFLKQLENKTNYIILEDEKDMGESEQHVVRTDARYGLTFDNIQMIDKKFEEQ